MDFQSYVGLPLWAGYGCLRVALGRGCGWKLLFEQLAWRRDTRSAVVLTGTDVSLSWLRFHASARWCSQGGERSRNCAAVKRSSNCIGPPQSGHRHSPSYLMPGRVRASGRPCGGGSAWMSRRHTGSSTERWRVLRIPKCRIRTKPLGSTCKRKRRRNSSSGRLICRFLFLCAESRHRKATLPSASEINRWFEIATRCV